MFIRNKVITWHGVDIGISVSEIERFSWNLSLLH